MGGAKSVLMSDVCQSAAMCSETNLRSLGLNENAQVQVSNLFDSIPPNSHFDLIVFAQPYFYGSPIDNYEFTKGMLDPEGLLPRFFEKARLFLQPGGHLLLMGWKFAGERNDPALIGPNFGFKVLQTELYFDWNGVQQGEFHIVLLG